MSRLAAGCVVLILLSWTRLAADGQSPTALPSHVRVFDERLAAACADGLRRSPTLRQLVDRIASLNGIVYVVFEPVPGVRKNLLGSLSDQVTIAGATSILRVSVRRNGGDAAVAMLAHEFRHAIELLEYGVRTEAEFRALFTRIGSQTAWGVFETDDAVAAERAVQRELLAVKQRR